MKTAANAPKIPAKNSATLSFMVPQLTDWPVALSPGLLKTQKCGFFSSELQRAHVTRRRHNPPPLSAIKRLLGEAECGLVGLLVPCACVMGGLEHMTPVDPAGVTPTRPPACLPATPQGAILGL